MTDNEALIPRIKAILAETRATSAESFQLQRLVVDFTERTVTSNDRERIAELERDLAHARRKAACYSAVCRELGRDDVLDRAVDDISEAMSILNRAVNSDTGTIDEMVSMVVHARDEARANLAQNAAITETLRAEYDADIGSLLRIAKNISTVGNDADDVPDYRRLKAKWRSDLAAPVVEEEQGPWVIINGAGDRFVFDSVEGWTTKAENAVRYGVKAHAATDSEPLNGERVITLAEAHRIAGAK